MKRFSENDLYKIRTWIHLNNTGGAYLFIAEKINSPLVSEFKKINYAHQKTGYLTEELNKRRYAAYQKLMAELKRKYPEDYEKVYGAL